MKVYVVLTGEYSDTRIYNIYTDQKKAEKIANILNSTGHYSYIAHIEDYELDKENSDNFLIYLRYDTKLNKFYDDYGTVKTKISDFYEDIITLEDYNLYGYSQDDNHRASNNMFYFFTQWRDDLTVEKLKKIAQDRFAQYKAERTFF